MAGGWKRLSTHVQRYLLTGVLTMIPLWITWFVFRFFLAQLSSVGMFPARALSNALDQYTPALSAWLLEPWFQQAVAVVLTLIAFYLLGWGATQVVGRRLIGLFERLIGRIPVVQTIYGSTKKLLAALQQKPEHVQRVVLIAFPTPEMKTVGFVTRILKDKETGRDLAAVYVPTTPNPTSGYLEIVPLENVISTDWTFDQAMSFIISGGAVAPETLRFTTPTRQTSEEASPAPDPRGHSGK
jgi:uncharacterized membrane protein